MRNNLTNKLVMILFLAISTLALSCKKSEPVKGEQGIAGPAGSTILSGNGVPATSIGLLGDFYLDLATSNFYGPKKADGWGIAFMLKGTNGVNGATGAAGSNGANGGTGATGADGADGENGADGAAGSQILSGFGLPDVALGAIGDYYLDRSTYSLFGPKTANGWGIALPLMGPAGPAGTTNVLYSGWNFATNTSTDLNFDGTLFKARDLPAPALTQKVLDEALIQVYLKIGNGGYRLPYISNAGGKVNTIDFQPKLGKFIITRFTHDGSNSINLSSFLSYRYVIIPGGIKLAISKEVDLNNYEAVRKYFRLVD